MKLLLFLSITAFAILIIFIIVIAIIKSKKNISKTYNKKVDLICNIPILKLEYSRVYYRLMEISDHDKNYSKKKIIDIMTKNLIIMIILIILSSLVTKSLLYCCAYIIISMVMLRIYNDYILTMEDNKLLKELLNFCKLISSNYYKYNDIAESFNESVESLYDSNKYLLRSRLMKIYKMVLSENAEKQLEKYYHSSSNNYFKIFAAICHINLEYGEDEKNSFNNSIIILNEEISIELLKREKLNISLKSLHIATLFPITLMEPIRNWATKNFMPVEKFYKGKLGLISTILMFTIFIICNYILSKVENEAKYKFKNIKSKNSTIKNITMGLAMILIIFTILSISNIVEIIYIKEKGYMPTDFIGGNISEEIKNNLEVENEILNNLVRTLRLKSNPAKIKEISEDKNYPQIINLQKELKNNIVSFNTVIISILFFIPGFYILELRNLFDKKIKKLEIENEVTAVYTVIMILSRFNRITVEEILDWMQLFLRIFKDSIVNCSLNISYKCENALINLKKEMKYEPMNRIIDSLIYAYNGVEISNAFESIIGDRNYFYNKKTIDNERIIKQKIAIGQFVGFLPMYGLIILYLLIPMLASSVVEMQKVMNIIN